jgi:hypothetical protein
MHEHNHSDVEVVQKVDVVQKNDNANIFFKKGIVVRHCYDPKGRPQTNSDCPDQGAGQERAIHEIPGTIHIYFHQFVIPQFEFKMPPPKQAKRN